MRLTRCPWDGYKRERMPCQFFRMDLAKARLQRVFGHPGRFRKWDSFWYQPSLNPLLLQSCGVFSFERMVKFAKDTCKCGSWKQRRDYLVDICIAQLVTWDTSCKWVIVHPVFVLPCQDSLMPRVGFVLLLALVGFMQWSPVLLLRPLMCQRICDGGNSLSNNQCTFIEVLMHCRPLRCWYTKDGGGVEKLMGSDLEMGPPSFGT